ncbi:MAG: NRAMP family divalent metal transporter, partial [Nitrospiria bacterium]
LKSDYLVMLIGVIGTTIAPWMQFYLQSAVVEKGVDVQQYKISRLDVIVGCIITDVVAFFIIVACGATLFKNHIEVETAKDAAMALVPLAGKFASELFAFGLANASLFAASILPLATAYYICEGFGWEAGVNKSFKEAPQFMWLYTGLIVIGAVSILVPNAPLLKIMLLSQVANGIMLPFVLIFMIMLINDKYLMGSFVNTRTFNSIAWITIIILIVLTILLSVSLIVPDFLNGFGN